MTDKIIKRQVNGIAKPAIQDSLAFCDELLASQLFPQFKTRAGMFVAYQWTVDMKIPSIPTMNSMAIIQGKLSIEAKVYRALFIAKGGDFEVIKSDDSGCWIELTKPGRKSMKYVYTIEDAEREGLVRKGGPWKTMKKLMCFERCTSRGIRAFDPGSVMGIYTKEEMTDVDKKTDFRKLSTINPLKEGEFPNGLMSKSELEDAKKVTGQDFTEAEVVEDESLEDEIAKADEPEEHKIRSESPAELDVPPDDYEPELFGKPKVEPKPQPIIAKTANGDALKVIGSQIHKDLAILGLEPKHKASFMLWLFDYQTEKSKNYCGKDAKGVHLSMGTLADLKELHSSLPDKLRLWEKST